MKVMLQVGREDVAQNLFDTQQDTQREDLPDCDGTFPDAHGDLQATLNYFRTEFNLTPAQTVALMGAHSLGT